MTPLEILPRRPRVLLDCDGVLSEFMAAALRVINSVLGAEYRLEDVTEFDFSRALGLDSEKRARVKRAIGGFEHFAATLEVCPGAVDGVRRLREIAEVYIVTSPWNSNPTWCHDREQWLKRHFDFPHSHVIHCAAKHVVCGDFLVDDKTTMCEMWRDAWPRGIVVQWETPHNRRDVWDGMSTSNWDALVGMVQIVAEGAPQ